MLRLQSFSRRLTGVNYLRVGYRTLFIQTESTPNEHALKFKPTGQKVVPSGKSYEFTKLPGSARHKATSALARKILSLHGVRSVFLGPDFISVNKEEDMEWGIIKPEVYATIMDFFHSSLPIIQEPLNEKGNPETEEEDEIVLMIKELLDSRVRPAVMEDGGDIEFVDFQDGIVRLKMQGSCRGCSSSSFTLKNGIENMMKHYIPEVRSVEQVLDETEEISNAEFKKLEENMQKE